MIIRYILTHELQIASPCYILQIIKHILFRYTIIIVLPSYRGVQFRIPEKRPNMTPNLGRAPVYGFEDKGKN